MRQRPARTVRRVALEIGRRLAERGQIARRDDVFHLEATELPVALRNPTDRRPLIRRRQGERAWILRAAVRSATVLVEGFGAPYSTGGL